MDESKHGLYMVAIVGIVAILGIVMVLIVGANDNDNAGQAARQLSFSSDATDCGSIVVGGTDETCKRAGCCVDGALCKACS